MWHNGMPRVLRLSVAAAGVLVLVGAPTATATPSDVTTIEAVTTTEAARTTTSTLPTTTSALPTTTSAAPTTTPRRYVSQRDSPDETPTAPSTTTSVTATTTAAPTTASPSPQSTTQTTVTTTAPAPSARADVFETAGRSGLSIGTWGPVGTIVPGATTASGTLPVISVSDNTVGSGKSWVATASSTDFVGPNMTIPRSAVVYEPTAIAGKGIGGALSSKGAQSLGGPRAVVERTGLDLLETISWTPALTVNYPGGAAVGTYRGTITVSVA